jgi:hypothetical protein
MMKRSITLLEMILAMSLLGTILIATTGIDLAARSFFKASDYRVRVANDLSFIFDHIQSFAALSSGWQDSAGYSIPSNSTLRIRLDGSTPNQFDDASDTWVEYDFNSVNNTIVFCDNFVVGTGCVGSSEILSSRIVPNSDSSPFFTVSGADSTLSLDISARYDPDSSASRRDNPEINLKTTVFFGQHSFD